MKRESDPRLRAAVLRWLANKYKLTDVREPNHLSSYVYCITKTFFDQKVQAIPTEEEMLLFAIGYGLQEVLTPPEANIPTYDVAGIIYRPDIGFTPLIPELQRLTEIKTTRKSSKYHEKEDALPETWVEYMMGGCKMTNTLEYSLVILYLMGNYSPPFPQLYTDRITFEQAELDANWLRLAQRKRVLDEALVVGDPPTPFKWNKEWECKGCRYLLMCQTISSREKGDTDG